MGARNRSSPTQMCTWQKVPSPNNHVSCTMVMSVKGIIRTHCPKSAKLTLKMNKFPRVCILLSCSIIWRMIPLPKVPSTMVIVRMADRATISATFRWLCSAASIEEFVSPLSGTAFVWCINLLQKRTWYKFRCYVELRLAVNQVLCEQSSNSILDIDVKIWYFLFKHMHKSSPVFFAQKRILSLLV